MKKVTFRGDSAPVVFLEPVMHKRDLLRRLDAPEHGMPHADAAVNGVVGGTGMRACLALWAPSGDALASW